MRWVNTKFLSQAFRQSIDNVWWRLFLQVMTKDILGTPHRKQDNWANFVVLCAQWISLDSFVRETFFIFIDKYTKVHDYCHDSLTEDGWIIQINLGRNVSCSHEFYTNSPAWNEISGSCFIIMWVKWRTRH